MFVRCDGDAGAMSRFVAPLLPDGDFKRIVLKPNWVMHEQDPAFPIAALVTSAALIDAVIASCIEKYPRAESITVGDVPLQSCDWDALVRQAGIGRLMEKYAGSTGPRVRFMDLRRERVTAEDSFVRKDRAFSNGDPLGYREVVLDERSLLDPVSGTAGAFRVSDYDPDETKSAHEKGRHRYLISATVLDADLFINLPKMKTHQKTGLTGALKNLVGINGQKAFLAHHRRTTAAMAGDEFSPDTSRAVVLQVRIRDALQGRSGALFLLCRQVWRILKRIRGIETRGTRENLSRSFYTGAGSWHGNDTVWRMVYDLNRVIRYAPPNGGALADTPQRAYCTILDGVVAGEGNGPLQPLPVEAGVIGFSDDPFLMDVCMAQLMGFDALRIPLLANCRLFQDPVWASFDAQEVEVAFDGHIFRGIQSLPVIHRFTPAPGWRGHIEK